MPALILLSFKVENKAEEFVLYMVHESGGKWDLSICVCFLFFSINLFMFLLQIECVSVCVNKQCFTLLMTLQKGHDWGMVNTHWWHVCFMDPVRKSPRSLSQRRTWERKSHMMWGWPLCHYSSFILCAWLLFYFLFFFCRHTTKQWRNDKQLGYN